MKKLWIVTAIILLALSVGYSQQIYVGNNQTIEWGGVDIANGVTTYELWMQIDGAPQYLVGETAETFMPVSVPQGRQVDVWVRTKWDPGNGNQIQFSDFIMASIEGSPYPFFLSGDVTELKPTNLRVQ